MRLIDVDPKPERPGWLKRRRGGRWVLLKTEPYYEDMGVWRERWYWVRPSKLSEDGEVLGWWQA